MRNILKLICTTTAVLILIATFSFLVSASDFDVSNTYFASSHYSEAFFDKKSADSTVTRGEAAQFLEDFVIKSASLGIIAQKNSDKSFSDGNAAVNTVYKYGVMRPTDTSEFGTSNVVTCAEFLSAWLTILGYSPEAGDFLLEFPYDCAGQIGIISSASSGELTFESMLDISFRALGTNFKGKTACIESSAAYGAAAKGISPSAENIAFKGGLGDSVLHLLGNVCGDAASRDTRFDVSVSRGIDTVKLDSYKLNSITASSSDTIIAGKRYTAFNFSGVITLNVALLNDFFSFEIFSSCADYSFALDNGILSISISRPQDMRVRFNGNEEQEIYIFAGAMGATLSPASVSTANITQNRSFDNTEFFYPGKIYINEYKMDVSSPAYFSTEYGCLVNANDLCRHFGLKRVDFDFGQEVYFNGIPYVSANSVCDSLGFEDCIIDVFEKSVKYVENDYVFNLDRLNFSSAANTNVAITDDGNGNFKLTQKKAGFGGLIANVTEAYGLSGGCLELDFDAFASVKTNVKATLVAKGADVTYASQTFSLSDSLRRCSHKFELNNTENTELYLMITPEKTTSVGLDFSVAKHTLTREEFYQQKQLVIYPEYPDKVNRIFDYKVTVTQGDRTEQLPVYNHTMWYALGTRTIGGDSYRRFSAFAFSGEQVRVDIKVSCDVECYSVMPSALGLKSSFKDGVISVYLDKPEYFLIRLNNRDTSIISIFADYPEFHADIPDRDAENVIWIDGWYEPTEDQHVIKNGAPVKATLSITEPNTILYIAPGAVLNARTTIASSATNTKVIGRGAIVDPYANIYKTDITQGGNEGSGYRPLGSAASGLYVDGISILDARSFHITATGNNVTIKNVKELSSMMTSDGISFYSGTNHRAEHCFMYVGDNAFVYSASGGYIKDCIIGTTCAAFFPQGSSKSYVFEDCHVFASYGGLINNRYNGSESVAPESRPQNVHSNTFINLDATDCVYLSWFFQGKNMGVKYKEFVFDGVSIPECTGVDNIHTTSGNYEIKLENDSSNLYTENYTLKINNLYVGGKAILSSDDLDVRITKTSTQKVASNTLIFTNDGKYKPVKQHNVKVGFEKPDKVYIGSMLAYFKSEITRIDGELAMPSDDILALLRTSKKPATVTKDGKTYIKASALVSAGAAKAAKEENGNLYITPVYNGENLLLPDTGEVSQYTESPSYQVELLTEKDSDGDWIYIMQKNPNSPSTSAGIVRFITDELKMYGAGSYVLSFKAKANEAGQFRMRGYYDSETVASKAFQTHTSDITTSWKTYTLTLEITEDILKGDIIFFKLDSGEKVFDRIYFTDIALTKK